MILFCHRYSNDLSAIPNGAFRHLVNLGTVDLGANHFVEGKSQLLPLRPRTTPLPEEKHTLGVIYGVLLWADMNAATPLGARGRLVISIVVEVPDLSPLDC